MGKHAAPRTSPFRGRTAQRAAAVSAGTVVLCLGAAAPAIAVTGVPTPPPIPQPVSDTVQQVSDVTGLPNPLAGTSTTKPHHHRQPDTTKPRLPLGHRTQSTAPTHHAAPATPAQVTPASYSLAGLRGEPTMQTAAGDGRLPTVAAQNPVTHIAQAAAQQLGSIPMVPPTQDTARILVVALAVMILGGLTSGHLKAAQQRIAAW